MLPTSLRPLIRREGVRCLVYHDRFTAILLVAALAVLLATPAQSATSGALSPATVTKAGTLLSAQPAAPDSIATTGSGAITLSSNAETPDTASKNSIEINNLRVSHDGFAGEYGITVPSIHLTSSDSGNFAAAFTSWQDETAAFEEVTAVPEPSTWLAAVCMLALLTWHQRRRFLSPRPISGRVPALV